MKKEILISVPKNWSAITLRQYIELQKDLKAYEGESEALLAAMFYHLCGVTPEIMRKLDTETFLNIKGELEGFISQTDLPLVTQFKWDNITYGIYPNLSKIEYGAYIDISKLVTKEMGEDWAKAMAILYRPITKQKGKLYEVANYTGEEEWEWFLDLGMDIHWGAYYFFFYLSMELLSAIPNSMMKMVEETLPNIKSILAENGLTIPQS
jgi:hypothetical protein